MRNSWNDQIPSAFSKTSCSSQNPKQHPQQDIKSAAKAAGIRIYKPLSPTQGSCWCQINKSTYNRTGANIYPFLCLTSCSTVWSMANRSRQVSHPNRMQKHHLLCCVLSSASPRQHHHIFSFLYETSPNVPALNVSARCIPQTILKVTKPSSSSLK